MQKGMILSKV